MLLARSGKIEHPPTSSATTRDAFYTPAPADAELVGPLVPFDPADLRQLWQCYRDLLELHRSEVVDDEAFENAHRLLVEQVLPLRRILREQEHEVTCRVMAQLS